MKTIEKLGQMFIVRMHNKCVTEELVSLIRDYHIGGVSLYSKNYDSYEEMLNLINDLKNINNKYNRTPLFIAIDQEGGRVNRLPKDFINLPSAAKLGKNVKYVEEAGLITSEILNNLGVNVNFAPVLDIQRFDDDHAIGDRCFGKNSVDVIKNGILMMNIIKKNNIIPVIKHFPGHGLVKKDSHFFLPIVRKNIKNSEDIKPFIEAIKEDAPAIMISHIMITKMDKFYPASLSKKVINNYLINELNYNGLIITDDLKMKAVNILYGYKKSSLKAVEAGNNLVLIGATYNEVKKCINYIDKKMNKEIEKNIENSYNKIIMYKKEYNINDNNKKIIKIDKYNDKIDKLKKI